MTDTTISLEFSARITAAMENTACREDVAVTLKNHAQPWDDACQKLCFQYLDSSRSAFARIALADAVTAHYRRKP